MCRPRSAATVSPSIVRPHAGANSGSRSGSGSALENDMADCIDTKPLYGASDFNTERPAAGRSEATGRFASHVSVATRAFPFSRDLGLPPNFKKLEDRSEEQESFAKGAKLLSRDTLFAPRSGSVLKTETNLSDDSSCPVTDRSILKRKRVLHEQRGRRGHHA